MLVGCATAASLFPFVGTIVYMILRPPEYLEDVRERELEMQAAEARLHELDHGLCPHCDYRVERDFVRCPSCLRKLKERCVSCSRPLDQAWTICPYCETEVPARAGAPAAGARSRGAPRLSSGRARERSRSTQRRRARLTRGASRPARMPARGDRGRRRARRERAPRADAGAASEPARPRRRSRARACPTSAARPTFLRPNPDPKRTPWTAR